MMRRPVTYLVLSVILLISSAGCKRIPLHERSTRVDLVIDVELGLDYDIALSYETDLDPEQQKKIDGCHPEYHEVLLYDTVTHELVTSQIVGAKGGQLHMPVGDYHMVIYSFGTESTQLRGLANRLESEAYTSDITKSMADKLKAVQQKASVGSKGYEDDPIIHEPDHLYVAHEFDVTIPAFTGKDETVTINARSRSIVNVYSLEIMNVKGTENIEKIDAFVTGQVRSHYFGTPACSEDPATLYITLNADLLNKRLYTIFGTFGKLSGEENKIYLDVTVTDSGGGQYRYVYDVTEQFDNPENTDHKLVIDGGMIDIPKSEYGGGGFNPSVDDWEREEIDVPLT